MAAAGIRTAPRTRAEPARGRRSQRKSLKVRERRAFWLFVSPWILGFIAFTGFPVVATLVLSFTDYRGTSARPSFIGLSNYHHLFQDAVYRKSLIVTFYYVGLSVPLSLVGAMALALLLNKRMRGLRIFRTIFYLPSVLSGVAVSLLWQWILDPNFGFLNKILGRFGLPEPDWFQGTSTVIPAFVLMSLWALGGPMVIYLAALQGVPGELYEAAQLDGATSFRQFLSITVPMLSPATLLNLITGIIWAFQVFVPGYVITSGGPNYASEFYVLYLFQNAFSFFRFGYAAAQAWILFLIIMVFTILVLWSSRRFTYYESD